MNNHPSIFDEINNASDRYTLLQEIKDEQFRTNSEIKHYQEFEQKISLAQKNEIADYMELINIKKLQAQVCEKKKEELKKPEPLNLLFNPHEVLLQAEMYYQCKKRNIPCFLEVSLVTAKKKYRGRIDIVINYDGRFYAIECKKDLTKKNTQLKIQLQKYQLLDVPIFLLDLEENIIRIIDSIKYKTLENKIYFFRTRDKKLTLLNIETLGEIGLLST